jgi:flagellar biogenesis protein FliO
MWAFAIKIQTLAPTQMIECHQWKFALLLYKLIVFIGFTFFYQFLFKSLIQKKARKIKSNGLLCNIVFYTAITRPLAYANATMCCARS